MQCQETNRQRLPTSLPGILSVSDCHIRQVHGRQVIRRQNRSGKTECRSAGNPEALPDPRSSHVLSWFRNTAITKNMPCVSKRKRISEPGRWFHVPRDFVVGPAQIGQAPHAHAEANQHPERPAEPGPSLAAARKHMAAARKLQKICRAFPRMEPLVEGPRNTTLRTVEGNHGQGHVGQRARKGGEWPRYSPSTYIGLIV